MNKVLQGFSHILSILFHPLFIIIYVLVLYLKINPYLFPYRNSKEFDILLIIVFVVTVFMPMITIFLMRTLGLIETLQMKEKTERIGPLIVTSIAYLWTFLNIRTHDGLPIIFSAFILGALISLFIAFFINNFTKISLHAVGMGGLLMSTINIMLLSERAYSIFEFGGLFSLTVHNLFLLALIIMLAGSVLSSRLYLKAHQLQDVTGGLLVGILGQLIAIKFF